MDLPVLWALGVIKGLIPDPALAFLDHHLLDPASPAQHLWRNLSALLTSVAAQMYVLLSPVLDRVTEALSSSPDLVVLAFFTALVFVIFQVLAYLQRIMLFWTRLALRVLFWSVVVVLAAAVWQRGIEASIRDAVVVGSKVVGFAAGAKDVFMREYQRYDELEKARRRSGPGGGRGF